MATVFDRVQKSIAEQLGGEGAGIKGTRAVQFGRRGVGAVLEERGRQRRGQQSVEKDSRSDPAVKKAKKEKSQEAPEEPQEPEIVEAPTTTNLEDLKAALDGNESFYEGLYSAELLRPSGPRKSALRMFLKVEMAHEDREDRKAEIEAALK